MTRHKFVDHSPSKIVVIKGGALGDCLLALPVLLALRDRFPSARMELIAPHEVGFLAEGLVDRFTPIWRAEVAHLYRSSDKADPRLRSLLGDADLLIAVSDGPLDGLPYLHPRAEFLRVPFTPPEGEGVHVTDFLLRELRRRGLALGLPPSRLEPPEKLAKEGEKRIMELCRGNEPPLWVAIHPGSGSPRKNWPARGFLDVIGRLRQRHGAGVLVMGGEADSAEAAAIEKEIKGEGVFFSLNEPLALVAGLLLRCRLYLGNDSGITHLSALLGVPTLALFGPTDPAAWGPRGDRVEILKGDAACSPCRPGARRNCADNVCMKSITVEGVTRKIGEMLGNS